jgi:bisphosphoglycerate-independent phosphoglycerate mutase (AlkP superfamily)
MVSPSSRPRPVALVTLDAPRAPFLTALAKQYALSRVKLDDFVSIDAGTLIHNPVLLAPFRRAKEKGGRVHLIGLVSDGGVESSLSDLFALIEIARSLRVRVVIHAILDGVDVPARSAAHYLGELEARLDRSVGRIGTVSGRAWAMDAEGRWERLEKLYKAIVADDTKRADSAHAGLQEACMFGAPESFVEPFIVFDYPGVSLVDTAVCFNFGTCRSRALVNALANPRFDKFARGGGRAPFAGRMTCMTPYDATLGLPTAFPRAPDLSDLPFATLAGAKLRQLHCTSGPASAIASAAEDAIRAGEHDFVLADFANPDNATRSGFSDSIEREVTQLVEAVRAAGGAALIVGGRDAQNVVPMVYVNDAEPHARFREDGLAGELGATLLALLQLPLTGDADGQSLLTR